MNDPISAHWQQKNRRNFLLRTGLGFGGIALSSLMQPELFSGQAMAAKTTAAGIGNTSPMNTPDFPHVAPKAKRVIYLFMAGGPSHIDSFDYKPALRDIHGKELPESIRNGQRITGMTSGQKEFLCVAPMREFHQHGERGTWVSDQLPYTSQIVDDITIIRSMNTEAVNHDPAITFINTGNQQPGRPSMGAWLSYGLGSENHNLPAYVVMVSRGDGNLQALYSRLWGNGFLPSEHQGVKLRSSGEPVLYLQNPNGITREDRRAVLTGLGKLNQRYFDKFGDPETQARIAQYELAYRMQMAAPQALDLADETEDTFKLYGEAARTPGTFAANCVKARRLAERGVRFIQLFHRGWDQHSNLPKDMAGQCKDVDQASAALVKDLDQRGMLEDTLVIWGGEFGRTIYSQGKLTKDNHGRDHHGRCFSIWMAGAGVRRGFDWGATDDYCYNITENPMHIRDLNATILHTLGINHERLTFKYQGLDQRLTGVEEAHVVKGILT